MSPLQIVSDGAAGGGTTMVLGLVDDLLQRHGWRSVVISQPGSYLEAEVRRRGLRFVPIDFFTSPFDLLLPWRLASVLRGSGRPLVHVHGLRAAHHLLSWPARPLLGPVVYTVHGYHHLTMSAPMRALADRAERRAARRADVLVHVSDADRRVAEARSLTGGARRIDLVANGVDLDALDAVPRRGPEIDVLFMARLCEPKDPVTAARALARLAAAGHRCVLAGDGPMRAEVDAALADEPGGTGVERRGALPREDALALLAASRVLLMPSRWEGLPLLPIEALALGVPVVASALPGIAEVVRDGRDGLLLEPGGDAGRWAAAVAALLAEPARLQALGRAGRSRVRERFDRHRASDRYAHLYRSLVSRDAPARVVATEPIA